MLCGVADEVSKHRLTPSIFGAEVTRSACGAQKCLCCGGRPEVPTISILGLVWSETIMSDVGSSPFFAMPFASTTGDPLCPLSVADRAATAAGYGRTKKSSGMSATVSSVLFVRHPALRGRETLDGHGSLAVDGSLLSLGSLYWYGSLC